MRVGVIDTGGGFRGIYAAGIFDEWLAREVHFDVCIGISAGGANVASFLAGQSGRNYVFYTVYTQRPEYLSAKNFVSSRSALSLDYIYGTLSNSDGENPLDFEKMMANPAEFVVIATDAKTGEPVYFDKRHMKKDSYDIFKASACLPFVCRPYYIDGTLYYDGALSDPIPIDKAFSLGCDKVILILSRPKKMPRRSYLDNFFARRVKREFPNAARRLYERAELINRTMDRVREYEKEGRVLVIAPDDIGKAKTLTRDTDILDMLYDKGRKDSLAAEDFLAKA